MVTAWPAYDVERTSVRVVLLDDDERLLLFRTVDPTMPEIGEWWELPGGGIEPGESYAETAVREIARGDGVRCSPRSDCRPAHAGGATRPTCAGTSRTWQHEVVVVGARRRARHRCPRATGARPEELEEYVGHRWWSARGGRGRRRHALLPRQAARRCSREFLAGEAIDEPFDLWN